MRLKNIGQCLNVQKKNTNSRQEIKKIPLAFKFFCDCITRNHSQQSKKTTTSRCPCCLARSCPRFLRSLAEMFQKAKAQWKASILPSIVRPLLNCAGEAGTSTFIFTLFGIGMVDQHQFCTIKYFTNYSGDGADLSQMIP